MNAITKVAAAAPPAPPGGNGMVPTNMEQAIRLAEMMARAKLVPQHLQASPGDCLLVVEQAMRWGMSPFAVAQCTSSIKGKLMFEGKLVAAAVEHSGAIDGLLDYQFSGEGAGRRITVSAVRRGESQPRTVEVALKDARTENGIWTKQPDQQLVYHGARVWARRWTPGVLLGVYVPEEMSSATGDSFAGPTIDAEPVAPDPECAAHVKPSRRTFRDTVRGLCAAATTLAEIEEIEGRADFSNAVRKAAPEIVEELRGIVAEARARLAVPRKPTVTEWLDALEKELVAATTAEAVDEITARPDVQKALDALRNGARDRLNVMCKAAMDRTADIGPDGDLGMGA